LAGQSTFWQKRASGVLKAEKPPCPANVDPAELFLLRGTMLPTFNLMLSLAIKGFLMVFLYFEV
jgi:hypothetical protein